MRSNLLSAATLALVMFAGSATASEIQVDEEILVVADVIAPEQLAKPAAPAADAVVLESLAERLEQQAPSSQVSLRDAG